MNDNRLNSHQIGVYAMSMFWPITDDNYRNYVRKLQTTPPVETPAQSVSIVLRRPVTDSEITALAAQTSVISVRHLTR